MSNIDQNESLQTLIREACREMEQHSRLYRIRECIRDAIVSGSIVGFLVWICT